MAKRESMAGKGRELFFPQAEPAEPAGGRAKEKPAPRRSLTARIPADLWERFDAYYAGQPRTVTKDTLVEKALSVFLDAKGA